VIGSDREGLGAIGHQAHEQTAPQIPVFLKVRLSHILLFQSSGWTSPLQVSITAEAAGCPCTYLVAYRDYCCSGNCKCLRLQLHLASTGLLGKLAFAASEWTALILVGHVPPLIYTEYGVDIRKKRGEAVSLYLVGTKLR
jgi:hypothetical protein